MLIWWLKLLLEKCLPSNVFVFRGEAHLQGVCVSLGFVSWLSHIACSAVRHGHQWREHSYRKQL